MLNRYVFSFLLQRLEGQLSLTSAVLRVINSSASEFNIPSLPHAWLQFSHLGQGKHRS